MLGDDANVRRLTDAPLALALKRRRPWAVGELAYWRWQAGVRDEPRAGAIAEPYSLSLAGEWRRAAELWRKIGCPYRWPSQTPTMKLRCVRRFTSCRRWEPGRRPRSSPAGCANGVRGVPRGPRPRTRQNPAGLTPRELEVLMLLAEGLRNAQIARRLVVSEKTVDHHVSAVLRKLDARTRGEASAEAVRLGLLDGG